MACPCVQQFLPPPPPPPNASGHTDQWTGTALPSFSLMSSSEASELCHLHEKGLRLAFGNRCFG